MTVSPRLHLDSSDIAGAIRDFTSTTSTMTAYAGGGQASATAITTAFTRVTTVATIGDSVKLPSATVGKSVFVRNGTANSMDVFPQTGQSINALSANTALAVAANTSAMFFCTTAGVWDSLT